VGPPRPVDAAPPRDAPVGRDRGGAGASRLHRRQGGGQRAHGAPLGLVSKGTTWYLVADTDDGRRTFRVWRVRSAELTDEPATRPPDFDLQRAWQEIVATLDERRGLRHVTALVDQGIVRWLRAHFAARLTLGETEADGRIRVEIGFPSTYDDPARELCGYAGGLEVLDPPDVRARMAELGALLVERHGA
jgi:predicted DNA-binding transcriptional regulator YafY